MARPIGDPKKSQECSQRATAIRHSLFGIARRKMAHKPVDIGGRSLGNGLASTGQQRQEGFRSLNVPMQSTLRDAAMSAAVLDICGQQCCRFGRRTRGAPWRDRDLQRTQPARPGVKSIPGSKTRTRTDWPPGSGPTYARVNRFTPLRVSWDTSSRSRR